MSAMCAGSEGPSRGFFFFGFLGRQLQHTKVPRLKVEPDLQPPA